MLPPQVTLANPELDGFKVKVIDTCGLEDPEAGDTVNYTALQRIAEDIKGIPIDVVMYVDRLDLYRVEPLDKRVSDTVVSPTAYYVIFLPGLLHLLFLVACIFPHALFYSTRNGALSVPTVGWVNMSSRVLTCTHICDRPK